MINFNTIYNEAFQQTKIKPIYGKPKANKFNDKTLMTSSFKILASVVRQEKEAAHR